MNLIEPSSQLDYFNRALPALIAPPRETPPVQTQSRSAEIHSTRSAATVSSLSAAATTHRIAHDTNSSQLVNFPFALAAFVTLGGGLLAMCAGMIGASAWLAALGCLLTLIGGGMYGWSLRDE